MPEKKNLPAEAGGMVVDGTAEDLEFTVEVDLDGMTGEDLILLEEPGTIKELFIQLERWVISSDVDLRKCRISQIRAVTRAIMEAVRDEMAGN